LHRHTAEENPQINPSELTASAGIATERNKPKSKRQWQAMNSNCRNPWHTPRQCPSKQHCHKLFHGDPGHRENQAIALKNSWPEFERRRQYPMFSDYGGKRLLWCWVVFSMNGFPLKPDFAVPSQGAFLCGDVPGSRFKAFLWAVFIFGSPIFLESPPNRLVSAGLRGGLGLP
jgi:hypothetical protein